MLENINLSIDRGEFVAIVGYTGSGKTTLINLIAGLDHADEGTIALNNLPIEGPGPDRGVVFQNYSLLPWLSVYENIRLGVDRVFPNKTETERHRHTMEHISRVHLTAAIEKKPSALSGGMRQRVSLARVLAMEPQIMLLDEPLGALDALTRANLQDEIASIWSGAKTTVVMITNDVEEGLYLADRIIPLTPGPGATLGPSITVHLPRPRNRKKIIFEPEFIRAKAAVVDYLRSANLRRSMTVTTKMVVPNIEPEDLSIPRPLIGGRKIPIRRTEVKRETISVLN